MTVPRAPVQPVHLIDGIVARLRPGWVRARALAWLDSRVERFAPMSRLSLPDGQRLAVVAPHPDDEAIGCGGLIALWLASGREVQVVALTDGEAGARPGPGEPAPDPVAVAARRRGESEAGLAALADGTGGRLGAERLGGPDGALWSAEGELAARLAALWRAAPPDLIAAPHPADRHADHAVAARIAGAAAPPACPVLAYEVWSPLPADAVIDIAGVADRKWRAIAAHASQTATTDYLAAAQGLARYRAVTAGLGPGAAEAYARLDGASFRALGERLRLGAAP